MGQCNTENVILEQIVLQFDLNSPVYLPYIINQNYLSLHNSDTDEWLAVFNQFWLLQPPVDNCIMFFLATALLTNTPGRQRTIAPMFTKFIGFLVNIGSGESLRTQ